MIVAQIIEEKRRCVDAAMRRRPLNDVMIAARKVRGKSAFKKHISRPHQVNLIAEAKKASPSRGVIRESYDPGRIAATYQANGAAAISVLTDEPFFGGKLDHLRVVKEHTTLPVLRKDFIIDEYQIFESRAAGADAVLLIADILSRQQMKRFYATATSLGMDVLLEVHNEEDLERALACGGGIIGINNRDLHVFKTDLAVTQKLIKNIPGTKVKVSESGIRTHEDIMFLKSLGVNAVLIGETFMAAEDIGAKVREILGK